MGDFEHSIPLALDKNTLESLVYLNLAQAQECFWLKAANDGLKNPVIAKLANEVTDLYSSSLSFCNRSSILKSEWVEHISLKKDHFKAVAQYRASIDCLDRSRYGEEVARLKVCVDTCTNAIRYAKYAPSLSSVLEDLKGLNVKAKSDLVRSEKDNDLIYLQEVVDEKNLPNIGKSSVSKPIIPPGIGGNDQSSDSSVFSSLLPYILYQTSRAFQEKIEAYVQRHIISEIDSLNSKLHSELQKLNLPGALDAVEKPLGVPQTLISYSEQLRANGGLPRLHETFQDISRLALTCEKLWKESNDILIVEENEDNTFRLRFGTDRWTRPTSKEAAPHIWEKLQQFKEHLLTANKLDEDAKLKLKPTESFLDTLSRGQSSLEQFLPHATVVKLSPILERSMADLRAAISKCRGIENDRAQYVKILQAEVNNIDLRKFFWRPEGTCTNF